MEPTSEPSPKRARSKSTRAAASTTAKQPRKRKAARVAMITAATPMPQYTEQQLAEMTAVAAYYLAAERRFVPGHELDDWLAAERQIRALCLS